MLTSALLRSGYDIDKKEEFAASVNELLKMKYGVEGEDVKEVDVESIVDQEDI